MSRRSSDCSNGLKDANVNDSIAHRNPLETESETDQDETNNYEKNMNFVSSP